MGGINNIIASFDASINALQLSMNGIGYADPNAVSSNIKDDIFLEGIFIRGFTCFENSLEDIFLHMGAGGPSKKGYMPQTRLSNCTMMEVREIVKNGHRYIDWSSPKSVRERSDIFFIDGEPFRSVIDGISSIFSDAEKIRNMIAHDSLESKIAFLEIQRRAYGTERPFKMTPGHLLRTRHKKTSMNYCSYYLSQLGGAVHAIANRT